MFDKLIDLILFKYTGIGKDNNDNIQPVITTGSIVLSALIRFAIIVILMWYLIDKWMFTQYWPVFAMIVVMVVFYPAYRQFSHFSERVDELEDSTLCGSCQHFEKSGQMCSKYDEHISNSYIPCEGLDWEPRS